MSSLTIRAMHNPGQGPLPAGNRSLATSATRKPALLDIVVAAHVTPRAMYRVRRRLLLKPLDQRKLLLP